MRIKGLFLWRRLMVNTVLLCFTASLTAFGNSELPSNFVREKIERLQRWRSSTSGQESILPDVNLDSLREPNEIGMIVAPSATRLPQEMSRVYFKSGIDPAAPSSYVLWNIIDSAIVDGQVVSPDDSGLLAAAVIDSVLLSRLFAIDVVWLGKTWPDSRPDDTFTVYTEEGVIFRDLTRHYHTGFAGPMTPEEIIDGLLTITGVQEAFVVGIPENTSEEPEPPHEPRCQYWDDSTAIQYYLFPYDSGGVDAFGAWDVVCEGISDNKEVVIGIDDNGFGTDPDFHPDISYNVSPMSRVDSNRTLYNHGTAVAGICGATAYDIPKNGVGKIGAVPDGRGVVGVSPRTKMVLMDHGGARYVSDLKYLIDSCDVDVLNFSWGIESDNRDLRVLLEKAFYVEDIALVAGAGNCGPFSGCGYVVYPAVYPFVVAVSGSTRRSPTLEDPSRPPVLAFHNFGMWLDLVAPSENVLTTGGASKFPDTIIENYGYYRRSGTSMSTAITSGVAALMKSANPELSAATLYDILTQTAKQVEGYPPGWNALTGWGIPDAREAALRVASGAHCDSVPGDANGDCYVNWGDALQVIRFLYFGVPLPETNNADVNADCQVDITDLQALIDNVVYGAGTLLYGCVETGSEIEQSKAPSSGPSLSAAYPNPFNPTTTIRFSLATATHYTLTIYNLVGQKVAQFEADGQPGEQTVRWDASGAASGIYLYRLNAGDFTASRKMLLLK